MVARKLIGLSLAASTLGHAVHHYPPKAGAGANNGFSGKKFQSLVTFGDSYTDDSRLGYFINHNGSAPPVGYNNPISYNAADGGRTWPHYVAQYNGTKNVYNYAVSGAVCSNNITPRFFSAINAPFPDLDGYEIPAYFADKAYKVNGTTPFLDVPADKTVYAIFDGTNDLGYDAFIQDEQVAGTNLTSYIDCIYTQVDRLYASGARYFVLMNAFPLYVAPIYALLSEGGVLNDNYWPDKPSNVTLLNQRMLEQVVTVNALYDYRTPVDVVIKKKYPSANFAVFSTYDLILDIHDNPAAYLNGTAPLSVTDVTNKCDAAGNCVKQGNPDSRLWYDDLHPSEQAERVLAREFVKVIGGTSSYATYWS